ncbi:MAG TPA: DUF4097 family beta strand repeat-containing protein [Gemmatimonadales bacterium]|nr:DUF4097 family beta strand repeat-containing protein [Gemmatimonadales bacterium]
MLTATLFLLAIQQAPFDTTIAVRAETRLEVTASAGAIDVKVWDRPAVRIVARPERGSEVAAVLYGAVLDVRARTPTGGIDLVSYEITVPRHMNLTLGRRDVDITVHGTEGSVDASIASGKIVIEGGRGSVSLRSFQGPIELRGARATVKVESTVGRITLTDVVGDVDVKSNSNHVTLENVDSRNLRAGSIAGVVRFSGPLHPDGRYALTSHSGSVFLQSPPPINASIDIATVGGAFSSPLSHTITYRTRSGIFIARFGNGAAQVTMESFTGGVIVEAIKPR